MSGLDRDRIIALADSPADDICDALLGGDEDLHAVLDPALTPVTKHAESAFDAVASVEPELWDGLLQVSTTSCSRTSAGSLSLRQLTPCSATGM